MTAPHLTVEVAIENWPLSEPFVISRGTKTDARVVVVTLSTDGYRGRGECVPYARYGETPEDTARQIREFPVPATATELQHLMPPGAARNALDCALWDLESKRTGQSVPSLLGLPPPGPVETCYTLSLGTPEAMADAARRVPHLKLLKLKLGGPRDDERLQAVRAARPDARLVADANEAWTPDMLEPYLSAARDAGVETIEQPLPAGADGALADVVHHVPVSADESAHTSADLPRLAGLYDAVNIKLDKTGGLTEAIVMAHRAQAMGFDIMLGSMVSTSLAVAPALIVAQVARWVDLDGPLLLAKDRDDAIVMSDGIILPNGSLLWG